MTPTQTDIELGPVQSTSERKGLISGFPATSSFIASDPAKTTLIFRRFDQLAVRNLLFLEARLAALEELQNRLDENDKGLRNKEPITTAAKSWEDFAVFGTYGREQDFGLPRSMLNRWKELRRDEVKEIREFLGSNLSIPKVKNPYARASSSGNGKKHDPDIPRAKGPETTAPSSASGKGQDPTIPKGKTIKRTEPFSAIGGTSKPTETTTFTSSNKYNTEPEKSEVLFDNFLGCDPLTMELIQDKWDLAQAIEDSLKTYQEAILRYREMLRLEPPATRTMNVVSDWIRGDIVPGSGPQFLPTSAMYQTYSRSDTRQASSPSTQRENDMVGIGRIGGVDILTRLVSRCNLLFLCKRDFPYAGLEYVPEPIIHGTVTIIIVLFAGGLVIGGIWSLYYLRIKQDHFAADLGLLSGLIILFALLVKIMTTASRSEIFLATAAYATIMVVFVAFQAPSKPQKIQFSYNGSSGSGSLG